MKDKNYLKDLQDIKQLMSKSTQFLSLSGLSGVLAGIYALVGAYWVYYLIEKHPYQCITLESWTFKAILIIAFIVLIFSLATAYFLSLRKAKRKGEMLINTTSKRAFWNFSIPMLTGGILIILLLKNQYYGLLSPMTLIFYGLSCVNVSKYTFRDVRYLGITEIILGFLAVYFSGYGLLFWVIGFGICHILYGAIMYFKYDRN
ncbi:hypothetical protein [Capnocytophaga catalasegens]|uniref:Brp/Blh family beta-carotene 15,15'-monooxygenase n=1 Tax=Capnocytophaga catalasegens TaxID=1004260 RepID=A0AAV5AUE7_9FLAO|nr:hypothetical protein [Capnocytophaga catalasegens]GIZ15425.1 hypothetical protein RCZ03_14250 [Capnocytophaga catalasegens]GJM51013.1 hypothetical protein RCZ15_19860 [Capnocytophaga catalasegens]GJM52198.1 hypothetical protein RCZ16_05160 [Capnocytophaga catalasegens]